MQAQEEIFNVHELFRDVKGGTWRSGIFQQLPTGSDRDRRFFELNHTILIVGHSKSHKKALLGVLLDELF